MIRPPRIRPDRCPCCGESFMFRSRDKYLRFPTGYKCSQAGWVYFHDGAGAPADWPEPSGGVEA